MSGGSNFAGICHERMPTLHIGIYPTVLWMRSLHLGIYPTTVAFEDLTYYRGDFAHRDLTYMSSIYEPVVISLLKHSELMVVSYVQAIEIAAMADFS